MRRTLAWILVALGGLTPGRAALRVPAFTAYLEPKPNGAEVSEAQGVTGWTDPALKVVWFGEFKAAGALEATLELKLPQGAVSHVALTIAGQRREASITGAGAGAVEVRFPGFTLPGAGYQRIELSSASAGPGPCGDVEALLLDGPAADNARFNLKPRRNAASVHWMYPTPPGTNIAAFYVEMTGLEDPLWTYYMACGWHRGYLGMQVNGPKERRIIFSVWDSGNEGVDRAKVGAEDRVQLIRKGEGVVAGDFGNEGTGGHSHMVYNWKTGAPQKFAVTAQPVDATHTIYTGYFYDSWAGHWRLVSSWKAPKEGGWLRGLYSFSEDFGDANGQVRRKALYGNQWVKTDQGAWLELTRARFSCDPTGKHDRFDRFGGVEAGQFFLSHGGFIAGFTEYGAEFNRPAGGVPPALQLP